MDLLAYVALGWFGVFWRIFWYKRLIVVLCAKKGFVGLWSLKMKLSIYGVPKCFLTLSSYHLAIFIDQNKLLIAVLGKVIRKNISSQEFPHCVN